MCVNTSYIFLALPASIAYNYNYGTAGRLETGKRIETGTLTFDTKNIQYEGIRRLNEYKIWGKQRQRVRRKHFIPSDVWT